MPAQNTQSWANIPPYLNDYLQGSFGQLTAAGQQFPTIANLPGATPGLSIPGMTPEQQQLMQQMVSSGSTAPGLQAAQDQLQQLTAGPIGSSPATQAGMQAFQQLTLPSIEQAAALQGNAAGGAAIEGAQQGATSAALPLIQQEIQNRQTAVGQYGQLQQQQMQSLAQAFEAAGLPREIALEQAQAAFDKAQQSFGIESGVQLAPLQMLGQFIGQDTKSYDTQHAWDYVGAVGKGLQGPLGNLLGGG